MCGTWHVSKGWYFPGEGWQLTCVFLYFKMEFFIAFIFSMIYWQQESLERKALKAFIWIDKEKRLNIGK